MGNVRNKDGSYGNDVIQTMDTEREQVRNRPGNYFGTNGEEGCAHGVFEIVTNSLDEIHAGSGNKVIVEVTEDNVYKVADNCGGVPMDMHPIKNLYNWHLIFNKLYGSGKYNATVYKDSAGLNGVGAAITQFASTYMKVISRRVEDDGKPYTYIMNFKNGSPSGELQKIKWDRQIGETTGTYVEWQPDPEVFLTTNVNPIIFLERFRQFAILIPEAEIQFKYKGMAPVTFKYERGMVQYIEELCDGKVRNIVKISGADTGNDSDGKADYEASVDIAFTINTTASRVEVYHNGILMTGGGVTYEGHRDALLRWVGDYGKKIGKIRNEKLSVADVQGIMVAVISSRCPGFKSFFKGQHKEQIGNPFLKQLAFNVTYGELDKWAVTNKDEAIKIVETVLLNKTARERADKVKKDVLKKIANGTDKFGSAPEKFLDCESKIPEDCEVYIVEGDSAKGTTVTARDYMTQAVFPLTGKIMNCLKKALEDILKNAVITDMIQIFGCSVEAKSKFIKDLPEFDINKLKYHKIIICTDADVDGAHITTLLIVMFYRLMPTLLKEGHVYIAEAPLYKISVGEDYRFAYSDEEKDEIITNLRVRGVSDRKIDITRFKGLGEMDEEEMCVSTMDKDTRRLTQIQYPEDDTQFIKEMTDLMGKDVKARRDMITRFFDEVDIDALEEGLSYEFLDGEYLSEDDTELEGAED